MPHLDEGALWVRATTPYTISFEEASKLSPQIRNILSSFPQVTTVANELGRPDDGTDPTGFFNNEFYVGLKPYNDSAWQGSIRTKPATDRSYPAQAGGVSRHHLQLHAAGRGRGGRSRNRAEELSGREDFRPRPGHPGRQGRPGEEHSRQGSRHHGNHRGARTGPAQPGDYAGPRQAGPLRPERERRQHAGGNRHGRHGCHAGDSGRAPVRPGGAHAGAVPQRRKRHQEPADRHARWPVSAAQPVLRNQGGERRVVHLSGGEFALHRRPVQRGRPRPGQRRRRSAREGGGGGQTSHRLQIRLGRRIQRVSGVAASR